MRSLLVDFVLPQGETIRAWVSLGCRWRWSQRRLPKEFDMTLTLTFVRNVVMASVVSLVCGVVLAQSGGGPGPPAQGPMAGAAGGPGGAGGGVGGGRGAARWGRGYTPGWSLMTPEERAEHGTRMRTMKTYEECKVYRDQVHAQMADRAKARGGQVLAQPRRDACAGLQR